MANSSRRDGLFFVTPFNRDHTCFGIYARPAGRGAFRFVAKCLDRRQALRDARQTHDLAMTAGKPMEVAVRGAADDYKLPLLFRTPSALRAV